VRAYNYELSVGAYWLQLLFGLASIYHSIPRFGAASYTEAEVKACKLELLKASLYLQAVQSCCVTYEMQTGATWVMNFISNGIPAGNIT